ncbi:RNA-directed DNA polymerase (Reverse transcriptase), Ribonuclease H [Gossypium australe]|uniref:RNA-directed DNA polymerase (Reverse transcriptase), Ribonuclease H n=1 Tax=Gossypium australe TaxID=47621 RepID=A0A5B6VYD2_9ROSI|nr:RNA-directed DNA polymerase (Reverse transcriptase), Ribonuclease H [Gossypium australe]
MTFPHISKTFIPRGTIHPKQKIDYGRNVGKSGHQRHIRIRNWEREFIGHFPLYTWKCSEQLDYGRDSYSFVLWIFLHPYNKSLDINDMSYTTTDLESPFEQDIIWRILRILKVIEIVTYLLIC